MEVNTAKLQGLKRLEDSLRVDGKIAALRHLQTMTRIRLTNLLRREIEQRDEQRITHRLAVHIASHMNIPDDRRGQIKNPNLLGTIEFQLREYDRLGRRIEALQSPARTTAA